MLRKAVFFGGAACAAGLTCAAAAAETVPAANRVVVTATRVPTPLEEVLAPTIVIDRAEIERSVALDVTELLRFRAGIDLGRNGGPGQTTALFIRGAESNHTLVMIDGVRINPGTIGLAQIQNLPPQLIERIEVVKGPRSALYGSDAIGGVINVVTRRGSESWAAHAGYGAYDTLDASLSGGVGDESLGFDFGLAWLDSAGFPTRVDDTVDRGQQNLSANVALRGTVGSAQLALRHFRTSGTTEYSDFFLTPVDQDFGTATTAFELAVPVGAGHALRVTASHLDDHIEQNQSPDYLNTRRDTLDAQFDRAPAGLHALSAGALYSRERAGSESYGEVFRVDTEVVNAFVQDRIVAGRHLGLVALGYTDHQTAGSEFTWNLEYGFALTPATQLFALAGTGFRAPDASDRFGYGGNPQLEPERSQNVEAGLRFRPGARHHFELSAFRTEVDELIEFVTLSFDPFYGENRNVERARIDGLEARYEFVAAPWFARVEAIHQDPENRTTGEQLYRRAKDSMTGSVMRSFGRAELGVDLLVAGPRLDFGFPAPVRLDGYVLANLTAAWRLSRSLTLSGRVENLFDEDYELADGYNTPGRGLYVALRYTP